MTYTEVLELIRAGYTKDEINAMTESEKAPESTKPEPTNPEPTKPEPNIEPEVPKETPPESEAVKLAKALGLKLDSMLTAIQNANIATAEQSGNTMTADDVIASIINPK